MCIRNYSLHAVAIAALPHPSSPPFNLSYATDSSAAGNESVILEWNPPRDNGGADITNYQIFINSSEVLRSNVTMATIILDLEEDHFVQVRAINCAGESDNASLLIGKLMKMVRMSILILQFLVIPLF